MVAGVKRSRDSGKEIVSKSKKPRVEIELKRTDHFGLGEASLAVLSEELMFYVLQSVPVESLGFMSMASNATAKLVTTYLLSDLYARRAALMLNDLGNDTRDVCYELGRAMKRATFLYPVTLRLHCLHQFLGKLSKELIPLEKQQSDVTLQLNKCVGEILSAFICGWADVECKRVFISFCLQYKINQAIKRFLTDDPGCDVENESFLRNHIRDLFLDPCPTDAERATWIGFISSHMGTAQLAKLILLLYGPLDNAGQLDWRFAFGLRSFEMYIDTYFVLARVVGSLRFIPGWTKQLSLEVLVYMSNIPNCWLLRSFASLLFLLSAYDKDVVFQYFCILYKSGRVSTASLLMALVLVVSPLYIERSRARLEENLEMLGDEDYVNEALLDSKAAFQFINNIIDHPELAHQRKELVQKMFKAIRDLSKDFATSFVVEDDVMAVAESEEDYHALSAAFQDYIIFSMMD